MFTFFSNRPGKVSSPFTTPYHGNSAGLRLPNLMKPCCYPFQGPQFHGISPPQFSPFSNPVGESPSPNDNSLPKNIYDYFGQNPSATRPVDPVPLPNQFQKPSPPTAATPAQAGPGPAPRKRFGAHKHLTMNHNAVRSMVRRRLAAEHKMQNKRPRHERLAKRARAKLRGLRSEVDKSMKTAMMTNEEKIFVQQLRRLHLDSAFRNDLSRYRETAERAEEETPERLRTYAEHDEEAARLREEAKVRAEELRIIQQRREENEKKRQAEEKERVEAERRRVREERERLERQRKLVEEQQRKAREAREKFLREERERRVREREAREREAKEREEREREAKEREREARERAEAQEKSQALMQFFKLYEDKWTELKTNFMLSSIDFRELPWPTLELKHFTPEEITQEGVCAFVLHALRPVAPEKSARDRVKAEVLRFHPDKFNARVLPKVREDQHGLAEELAGAIVRALTTLLAEVEQGSQSTN